MVHEHTLPLDEYHRAGLEITNGNPDVYKGLYSRRDDVTLANPFGPPARGWSEVSARLDGAADHYREGEVVGFENIVTVTGSDLAYTVEIESYRARSGARRSSYQCLCASRPSSDSKTASGRSYTGTVTRSRPLGHPSR